MLIVLQGRLIIFRVYLYICFNVEQVQMGDFSTNLGYRFYPNALCLEVGIATYIDNRQAVGLFGRSPNGS